MGLTKTHLQFHDHLRAYIETEDKLHLVRARRNMRTQYHPDHHGSYLRGVILVGNVRLLEQLPDKGGCYSPFANPERILRRFPKARHLDLLLAKGMSASGLSCALAPTLKARSRMGRFFSERLARQDPCISEIMSGDSPLFEAPMACLVAFIENQTRAFPEAFEEAFTVGSFVRHHNWPIILAQALGLRLDPEKIRDLDPGRRRKLAGLLSAHGRLRIMRDYPTLRHAIAGWRRRDPLFLEL